jgi:hypothetical protein
MVNPLRIFGAFCRCSNGLLRHVNHKPITNSNNGTKDTDSPIDIALVIDFFCNESELSPESVVLDGWLDVCEIVIKGTEFVAEVPTGDAKVVENEAPPFVEVERAVPMST